VDENFIGPIKHRRGDVRADGMLFWVYREYGERWLTPEKFEQAVAKMRASGKKHYDANKEEKLAAARKFRAENKDLFVAMEKARYHHGGRKEQCAEYVRKNQDRIKAHRRERYLANRERILEERRLYRLANPEKAKAAVIRWRKDDPERSRESSRRCYRKHWEVHRARAKAAYLANPHKSIELSKRRKAAKKAAVPEDFNAKRTSMIYAWAKRVQKCLGIEMHVDHIVPLAKGGKHNYDNLQVLPAQLNMRKQDNEKYELPGDWRRPPKSA